MANAIDLTASGTTPFQSVTQKPIKTNIGYLKTSVSSMASSSANSFYLMYYGQNRIVNLIRTDYEDEEFSTSTDISRYFKIFSCDNTFILDKIKLCPSESKYLAGVDQNKNFHWFEIKVVSNEVPLVFEAKKSIGLRVRDFKWHPYCKKILAINLINDILTNLCIFDLEYENIISYESQEWVAISVDFSFDAKHIFVKTINHLIVILNENLENEYSFFVENLIEICMLEEKIFFYCYCPDQINIEKKEFHYNLLAIERKNKFQENLIYTNNSTKLPKKGAIDIIYDGSNFIYVYEIDHDEIVVFKYNSFQKTVRIKQRIKTKQNIKSLTFMPFFSLKKSINEIARFFVIEDDNILYEISIRDDKYSKRKISRLNQTNFIKNTLTTITSVFSNQPKVLNTQLKPSFERMKCEERIKKESDILNETINLRISVDTCLPSAPPCPQFNN